MACLLAASARVLTAASLDQPTAAAALGLLLLLLCSALSAWRWGSRRRMPPAERSSHGSQPGGVTTAGTSIAQLYIWRRVHACSCDLVSTVSCQGYVMSLWDKTAVV